MSGAVLAPPPWLRPLWRPLAGAIAAGRLHHALLLSGVPGTGKRAFARALAAALWCARRDAEGIACGTCEDCRQVASEAHSGYHCLRVPEDRKDIPIDKVRALIEALRLTAHDGRARIAIVDPADALNLAGVNAVLKTIEEPSPGAHLVLISERPRALPATLRSRCQQLRCAPPARGEGLRWLREAADGDWPAARLEAALDAAGGAPYRAQALLESKALDREAGWAEALLALAAGRGEPLALAAAIGDELPAYVAWLHGWLLRLLRARVEPGAVADAMLTALAARLPAARLDAYLAEVQQAQHRITTTANRALLAESLLIGWYGLLARAARATQNPRS